MSKLDTALQHALALWRTEVELARSSGAAGASAREIEERRVTVTVTYSGDVARLRAAGLETGSDSGTKVSGLIALRDVPRLEAVPEVVGITVQPRVRPMLNRSVREMRVPWKVPPATPWPGKGKGAIIAVIDTGIDIFHESFQTIAGRTRILELWDQGAAVGGSAPPAGFMQVGRVYSAQNINDGLTAGPPFASVDTAGHGTHVAGIAAGNGRQDDRCSMPGRYVGVAPEADLLIVKMVGVASPATFADTLRWCDEARARLGVNKPLVINCSFGTDMGPHDGTGALDVDVNDLLHPAAGPRAGLALVAAVGNSADEEIREAGHVAVGATATVPFYVPKGSARVDMLDIWYNGTATLNVELVAPSSSMPGPNTTGPVVPGSPTTQFPIGQMRLTIISDTAPNVNHNNRKEIIVSITPNPGFSVRPGIWQLRLTHTAGAAADWEAWFEVEHGDAFPTFHLPSDGRMGRRRENTVGQPASARTAIGVASYDDGELAESSGRGNPGLLPATPVGQRKPTIAAPGVGVTAPHGRDASDRNSSCCDQKVSDVQGTSIASPHVAGLVALMFDKNRNLTFEQVRAHLQKSARFDGIPSGEVPPVVEAATGIRWNYLWGSGKVDAAAALASIPAAAAPGGGGGPGGPIPFSMTDLGYTPHNLVSRLGEWNRRFGPRPGLMLFASIVSEHVDEVLRLVNHSPRVGAVWRRHGGPLLVRRLLHGPPPSDTLLPRTIDGCDVADLLARLLPMLTRFGGPRLRADIARFRGFIAMWPGGALTRLDRAALDLTAAP